MQSAASMSAVVRLRYSSKSSFERPKMILWTGESCSESVKSGSSRIRLISAGSSAGSSYAAVSLWRSRQKPSAAEL